MLKYTVKETGETFYLDSSNKIYDFNPTTKTGRLIGIVVEDKIIKYNDKHKIRVFG